MSANTTRVVDRDDGGVHDDCGGHYWWRRYCGAYVCDKCDDHKGLGRCFCGWRSGQNRVWVDGKIVVEKESAYAFEAGDTPETPEGEDNNAYFGDEPVDEDGFYRD